MMWMSRAALEYIGQAGLGYSFDALDEEKTNEYSEAIKMLTYDPGINVAIHTDVLKFFYLRPKGFGLLLLRRSLPYIVKIGPAWFRRKLIDISPIKALRDVRNIIDVMDKTSKDIYDKKKQALAQGDGAVLNQVGRGKDIMSLLCSLCLLYFESYNDSSRMIVRANTDASDNEKLPDSEVLGQMRYVILWLFVYRETENRAM